MLQFIIKYFIDILNHNMVYIIIKLLGHYYQYLYQLKEQLKI